MNQDRDAILAAISNFASDFHRLSLVLHSNPEISCQENQASAFLSHELEQFGFEVEYPLPGFPTAFRAHFRGKSGKPCAAFICEYDALPDLGHACGHNLIAASSIASAVGLKALGNNLPGSIMVIGTPDEEKAGAKVAMLKAGFFEGADCALAIHPHGATQTRRLSRAARTMRVTFQGKASHAVASPEQGINALDSLVDFYHNMKSRADTFPVGTIVPVIIREGGIVSNIIPERAVGEFTIRAYKVEDVEAVFAEIKKMLDQAAEKTGATYTLEELNDLNLNLVADPKLHASFIKYLDELGIPYDDTPNPNCGSSDMGNVSQAMPTLHPVVSISKTPGLALHTKEFAIAAATDYAHEMMLKAAQAQALTAYDFILAGGK